MEMDCGRFIPWLALRQADLGPSETEALVAHLAVCDPCRQRRRKVEALDRIVTAESNRLGSAFGVRPPRPLRWGWAAAAAVVVALAWSWRKQPAPSGPLPSAGTTGGTAPAPLVASGIVEAERSDLCLVLGPSALASLRQGSRVRIDPASATLVLGCGEVSVEGWAEPFRIRGEGWSLCASGAEVAVALPPGAPASGWLREAHAGAEEGLRVSVRRGTALLIWDAGERTLSAGEGGILQDGSFTATTSSGKVAWWGPEWREIPEARGSLRNGVREFPLIPPGSGCVLEILARKSNPSAELGVRLAAGGRIVEVPVGMAWGAFEGPRRIRIAVSGGLCLAAVGTTELVRCAAPELPRSGPVVEGKGAGLRAWGGDVEILSARWRAP